MNATDSKEILRLVNCSRDETPETLLQSCLNGRELNVDNVRKLFLFTRTYLSQGHTLERICGAALAYLGTQLNAADLRRLKRKEQRGCVLDEIEERNREAEAEK